VSGRGCENRFRAVEGTRTADFRHESAHTLSPLGPGLEALEPEDGTLAWPRHPRQHRLKRGARRGRGGTAGDAGTALPMMITCTETAPTTPVMCGGEVCQAPAQFPGNPCIVPCCIIQGGEEVCASKSTAVSFSSECAAPAVADPQCPEVNAPTTPLAAAMGLSRGTFKGCCNARQHKCGIISGPRPGCATESLLVTLPADAPACSEAPDDGGTHPDGG